jgi:hypothetical protein
MTTMTKGRRERRGRSNSERSAGGLLRGSVVGLPQREQMSALSAMSVSQYLQIIEVARDW